MKGILHQLLFCSGIMLMLTRYFRNICFYIVEVSISLTLNSMGFFLLIRNNASLQLF